MARSADDQRGSERLGRYLKQLRLGYGYTLRRVEEQSETLGFPIDNSQLSRFEKGKAAPSFDKLRVLARVFNVPVQSFADILDLQECDEFKSGHRDTEALFQEGLDAYRQGEYARSYAAYERLMELSAGREGPVWAENDARARYHMAIALRKMGRLSIAESELRRLLRRPEDAYPLSLRVWSLLQLSFVYRELGDLYLASVVARECRARATQTSDRETLTAALNTAGIIAEERGRFDEASRHFREALDVIRDEPDKDLMRITVQVNLGGALASNGRFKAGVTLLRQALGQARRQGFRRPVCLALTKLGRAYVKKSRPRAAAEFLKESNEIASAGGETYNDILFINAYLAWRMARESGKCTKARILFGRLKYLRSTLESRFPEVDAFDAVVRGETSYA